MRNIFFADFWKNGDYILKAYHMQRLVLLNFHLFLIINLNFVLDIFELDVVLPLNFVDS